METVFYSDFSEPDNRWVPRHTPTPDIPAWDRPARIEDGKMKLNLRERNGLVYSSHYGTAPQTFLFGRFEARMRFFGPKGAHSAFWLQDLVTPYAPGRSEVDIVEHFGENKVWHNVYYRTPESAPWPYLERTRREIHKRDTGIDPFAWHTYRCDWYPDRYEFFIDGKPTATITDGLSSTPKVMILSVLSSDYEWKHRVSDLSVYRTSVDWVRVRQEA